MKINVGTVAIEARMPTLRELSPARRGLMSTRSVEYDAAKGLVKACILSPTFDELLRKKPACLQNVANRMVEGAGLAAEITLLEEGELDAFPEFAKAYFEAEKKVPPAFKVDPDERGKLFPVAVESSGARFELIFKYPNEQLVERVRKADTCEGDAAFLKSLAVHGDVEALAVAVPAACLVLAGRMLGIAGSSEVERLGE